MPAPDPRPLRVAAQARPFSTIRTDLAVPAGLNLAEIVAVAVPDPAWHDHAIGDERIDRALWARVRPKAGAQLAVHIVPRGQNGWRIAGMIVIAVLAITVSIAVPQALPAAWPVWAKMGIAAVASAAVSVGGTYALNALVPPPIPEVSRDQGKDKPSWVITRRPRWISRRSRRCARW